MSALAEGQTTMLDKSKELGVQTISLQELLQRMGYKSPVSTKATGSENDAIFAATARASSSSLSAGTTRATRPLRSAGLAR